MSGFLVMLAITFCAWAVSPAQNTTRDEIRLRATVQRLVPMTNFSGSATPVDTDPRFALTVLVESAIPASGFSSGSVFTFAIHSPSLLFQDKPKIGKTYDFLLRRRLQNGRVKPYRLSVQNP